MEWYDQSTLISEFKGVKRAVHFLRKNKKEFIIFFVYFEGDKENIFENKVINKFMIMTNKFNKFYEPETYEEFGVFKGIEKLLPSDLDMIVKYSYENDIYCLPVDIISNLFFPEYAHWNISTQYGYWRSEKCRKGNLWYWK